MASKHVRREHTQARRRRLIVAGVAIAVILALVLVYVLAAVGGGGSDRQKEGEGQTEILEIGGIAEEDGVSFEVTSGECGFETVQGGGAQYLPNGQYCLILIMASAQRPTKVPLGCQYLELPRDQRVESFAEASSLITSGTSGSEVSVGEPAVQASLIFDIPAEARPRALILHSVCKSPGVRFEVTGITAVQEDEG